MKLEFEYLNYLWWSAASVGAILLFILGFKRAVLKSVTVYLRLLLLLLLGLALSEPRIKSDTSLARASVLVDVSDSMEAATASEMLKKTASFRDAGIELDIIPFAKTSKGASGSVDYDVLKAKSGTLDAGGTNLAESFKAAGRLKNSSVIFISDGWATLGSEDTLFEEVAGHGMQVFPIVPEGGIATGKAIRISNLFVPLVAPAQKSVEARVAIQNTTEESQKGTLKITHENKVIFEKEVEIPAHEEALFQAKTDPSVEGIHEVKATFKPSTKGYLPSSEIAYLSGSRREHIVLISGTQVDERILKQVLESQSYQVDSFVAGISDLDKADLSKASAIILNNISAADLGIERAKKIKETVKQGTGFVMIGGNKSFGVGGYVGNPLFETIAVESIPPRTVMKRVNVAVELVLDKSQSMSDSQRMDYARTAAKEVVRNLKDDDLIGVIGFDNSPFVVLKLDTLLQNRMIANDRIDRLIPKGRTNLLPALDEARRSLQRAEAGRKHVIVLTDGRLPDESSEYLELAEQMRAIGITLSTVLISSDVSTEFLRTMANSGGGSFYQTSDVSSLPRIFMNDIKASTGEKSLQEATEFFVRRGSGTLKSTEIESFPSLRGFVETKPRDDANLELVVAGNEKAYPLLASMMYGKGKSIAFTSDANGRWSSSWAAWPKFSQFWSDIVDAVRPHAGNEKQNIDFDLRYFVNQGALELDLSIYTEGISDKISAVITTPDGGTKNVTFSQLSPGHYRASLPQAQAGKYEVKTSAGDAALSPVAFYISGELFGEQKSKGFNVPFLERLASESRGKINPGAEDVRKVETKVLWSFGLAPLLFVLALLVFFVEIWARERQSRF